MTTVSISGDDLTAADLRSAVGSDRSAWMKRSHAWLLVSFVILIACAAVWIVSDALSDLWLTGWNDPEASHILLVPIVFVWLAWERRARLPKNIARGRWPGVFLLAAGLVLWKEGYHYQIRSFWHFGAVLLVAGSVIVILGREVLWNFLPAWAALIFLVPVPGRVHSFVAIPLERVTAMMTCSVAEVLGMHVTCSGNQLTVNGIDVCVVEACNGMRMAFTLLMACYVFAFVRPLRWWVRLIILVASPIVAVCCNVIRLVPTVWMFGNASNANAERFHDFAGWGMLLLAFALLTGIVSLLDWVGIRVFRESNGIPSGAVGRSQSMIGVPPHLNQAP